MFSQTTEMFSPMTEMFSPMTETFSVTTPTFSPTTQACRLTTRFFSSVTKRPTGPMRPTCQIRKSNLLLESDSVRYGVRSLTK
jgi:hypothetical protein